MSPVARASALAAFRQRSFRVRWPADLSTSWAFEMKPLILGWYALTETGSVLLFSLLGALQLLGTLIAPMFGVTGDRVGHRLVLCATRITCAVLAAILATVAPTGTLSPAAVCAAAAFRFALLLLFARVEIAAFGMALLALAGFVQGFAMLPLAAVLLRVGDRLFRDRIMGLRMLAVYGLPAGLVVADPLIAAIGLAASVPLYRGFGLASTAAITLCWRRHLWPSGAPPNGRQA